jgi:hypothetical protein
VFLLGALVGHVTRYQRGEASSRRRTDQAQRRPYRHGGRGPRHHVQ